MMKRAFTVLELLIVLSVFMIIFSFVLPQTVKMLFNNDIEVASQELVHVLRKANSHSVVQFNDSSWGVKLNADDGTYTFYSGSDYSSRDLSKDIVYSLPPSTDFGSINLNGAVSEVIFDQITGETSEFGTIELVSDSSDPILITVNAIGNVLSE